jgi:hypothetical protein
MHRRPVALALALVGAGAFLVSLAALLIRPVIALALGLGAVAGTLVGLATVARVLGRPAALAVLGLERPPAPPPGTYRARPVPRRRGGRLLGAALLLAVALLVTVAVIQTAEPSRPAPLPGAPAGAVPIAYEAMIDARGDAGRRWRIRETLSVGRGRLVRLLRGNGGAGALFRALPGRWRYQRAASRGDRTVYVRSGDRNVDLSVLPVIEEVALRVPFVRVRGTDRTLVPRDGSTVKISGARRLIYNAEPPVLTRRASSASETVRLRLGDARRHADARVVRVRVANRLGRLGVYAAARDAASWPPMPWLLAALAAIVAGSWIARPLLRQRRAAR